MMVHQKVLPARCNSICIGTSDKSQSYGLIGDSVESAQVQKATRCWKPRAYPCYKSESYGLIDDSVESAQVQKATRCWKPRAYNMKVLAIAEFEHGETQGRVGLGFSNFDSHDTVTIV